MEFKKYSFWKILCSCAVFPLNLQFACNLAEHAYFLHASDDKICFLII